MIRIRSPRASRSLVAAVALLIVAGSAQARVHPGFELGVNTSSLQYDDMNQFPLDHYDEGWRPSFTGGLTLEVPFAQRFALQTGLRYVQQGNSVKYDLTEISPGLHGKFRIVQNYLSLPVLMAWRPFPSNRFSFALGPEVALLLSAESVVEEGSGGLNAGSQDIKDFLESTNLTLDAGAGYEFPFQAHTGTLGVRYTYGLTDVAKKDAWVSTWTTQGIEALIGMRW